MNCYVCNEDMGNMKVCPRCQFQMILPSGEEDDTGKKERADQYRRDFLKELYVGIVTYEWDLDEKNDAPKLINEIVLFYPQPDPLEVDKVYWIEESFAAARGSKETELNIQIKRNLPSGRHDEEEVRVSFTTDWDDAAWKTGISISKGGDLILVLGNPDGRTLSKEIFNLFMWCE